MEVPTVIGLGLGFDGTSNWINKYLVDRYLFGLDEFRPEAYGIMRKFLVLWTFLTIFTFLLYFSLCPLVYYLLYTRRDAHGKNFASWDRKEGKDQVINEIKLSVFSIIVMAGMTAPFELLVEAGLTKIYWVRLTEPISDSVPIFQLYPSSDGKNFLTFSLLCLLQDLPTTALGWFYLTVGSPLMFLLFSDTCVYWIHRALHHRLLYAPIHKLHHKYKETTPFSSYAFHPLDGWLQGCPYHIFVFIFPMHHISYFCALAIVGLWTINIHDRTTYRIPFINGAAHHTIHHTGFTYNYGQYFVFWDIFGGTFRNPYNCAPYSQESRAGKSGSRETKSC